MNFKFMMYFYLHYVHQHVSAGNTVIFRMAIQEYNCNSLCHYQSMILKICSEAPHRQHIPYTLCWNSQYNSYIHHSTNTK